MLDLKIMGAITIAYLFGSVSSAIIICRLMNLPDPRTLGSRNPGATNVLRIGGKKAAIITLLGDMLKGFIPVWIAKALGFDFFSLSLIAFAAVLGHLFPIFFRFEGGKGIATAMGVLLGLSWQIGVASVATWTLIVAAFRYSSLASIGMCLFAPLYIWFFSHNTNVVIVFSVLGALLILRHYQNIKKLITGTESKIGKK